MSHVPLDTWVDYVRGRVPADQRERLLDHLSDCDTCARVVARLADIQHTLAADEEPVPEDLVRRAVALASGALVRRLSVHAGGTRLELDVTLRTAAGRASLAGRVSAQPAGIPLACRITAYDAADGSLLGSAQADARGDFYLECRAAATVRLAIHGTGAAEPIEVFVKGPE